MISDNAPVRCMGEECNAAVAVIGLACWLPGAENPETFWDVLGDDAGANPPIRHGLWRMLQDRPAPSGFTDGPGEFGAEIFGISARELATLDSRQRLVFELCWAALEDTGIPPGELCGTETEMFLGGGRAVHRACESLRSGAARLALADGVHLNPMPEYAIGFARDSVGVAVLKRLAEAVTDGDFVYCVMVGGDAAPTVPDTGTQQALLRAAHDGMASAGRAHGRNRLRPSVSAHGALCSC